MFVFLILSVKKGEEEMEMVARERKRKQGRKGKTNLHGEKLVVSLVVIVWCLWWLVPGMVDGFRRGCNI